MSAVEEKSVLRLPFVFGHIAKAESRQNKSAIYSYLLFLKATHNGDLGPAIEGVSFFARGATAEIADRFLGKAATCPYFFTGTHNEGFRVRCVVELRAPFTHCPIELEFDVECGERTKTDKRVSMCVNSDELLLQNCPPDLRANIETGLRHTPEPSYKGELLEAALALKQPEVEPYRRRLETANAFLQEEVELAAQRLRATEEELAQVLAVDSSVLQKRERATG